MYFNDFRSCWTCCVSNLKQKSNNSMETQNGNNANSSKSREKNFLSTLRKFKSQCLSQAHDSHVENDSWDEQTDIETCNVCFAQNIIVSKPGYWIECTSKLCPTIQNVIKMTDKLANSFMDLGSSGREVTKVFPEEIYENYFYGSKHWNYYSRDEKLGPVILSLKQEFRYSCDFLRVMVRSSLHVIHGMVPVSDISASPYGHEEVVKFLSKEIGLESQLKPITLPTAPTDLLKIDKVFLKDEFKVGIVYIKEDQTTEEEIFNNQENSQAFEEFLILLGDRVELKGFSKYRGGLDIVHNLTGTHSVHTNFGTKQIMFHVSTLLPFEEKDSQKLQRKRHIGNDIACIVFLEGSHTAFDPECIRSNFLHTFIVVQVDVKIDPTFYKVSVVSRNQVPLYSPSLAEKNVFEKGPEFRSWILSKVINGETACHKAPNFFKLHQRTRTQLMNELINSVETNSTVEREKREPLPFREHGRWSQSSISSLQDPFTEGIDFADFPAKDFSELSKGKCIADVRFIVGKENKKTFLCVKSLIAAKSSELKKILVDDSPNGTTPETPRKTSQNGLNSPTFQRTTTWGISSSILPGSSRSRKFSLKKSSRSQSCGEDDVVLSSFSGLDNQLAPKNNRKNSNMETVINQEITIEDFEPEDFEAFLTYLHSGSCHITAKILPGLLSASYQYKVLELQQVCEESIDVCLDETTVYTFLQSMEKYPQVQQKIENKIEAFLQDNPIQELNEKEASLTSEKHLKLLLSSVKEEFQISKFKAIIEWSKHQSVKMDCCVSIEELAKPLIASYVDLTKLSGDDLMQIVYPSGLVSDDQLLVIMAVKADNTES